MVNRTLTQLEYLARQAQPDQNRWLPWLTHRRGLHDRLRADLAGRGQNLTAMTSPIRTRNAPADTDMRESGQMKAHMQHDHIWRLSETARDL